MREVTRLAALYIAERSARGELTGRTPRNVRFTLSLFARSVGDIPGRGLRREHVDAWLASMTKLAPATRRSRLATLRPFTAWLTLRGHVRRDPCLGMALPKVPRSLPRSMPAADVARLLAFIGHDPRAVLVALLMVQECLRCAEVAGLQQGDVDRASRSVFVVGKGGHQRVVWLTDETLAALERYEEAEGPFTAGPLLRSRLNPSAGLSATYVSTLMSGWMRGAGVKRRPFDGRSAHALRHTGATDMLDNGASLPEVQLTLGHATLQPTGIYVKARSETLRRAMDGRRYRELAPV